MSQTGAATLNDHHRGVRLWLYGVAALLIALVAVGGATRLTDSGLSITEWQPILGAIPPLSEADWQVAFQKYQQIPEYQQINKGMSMAAFQTIFWWEWAHRFFARLLGLAFFVPLILFWLRGAINGRLGAWLLAIFALGGLQGFVGWYMVASGLTERTDVSQYRLALHLGLAILLLGLIVWTAWSLRPAARWRQTPPLLALVLPALVYLQIILGAFVAGLDAGLSHTTWPLMDGALIPSGLLAMEPWWRNAFENVLTVQFNHRMLAYGLVVLALVNLIVSPVKPVAIVLAALMLAQALMGIWTLLALVPVELGVAHQLGAVAVLLTSLWHLRLAAEAMPDPARLVPAPS